MILRRKRHAYNARWTFTTLLTQGDNDDIKPVRPQWLLATSQGYEMYSQQSNHYSCGHPSIIDFLAIHFVLGQVVILWISSSRRVKEHGFKEVLYIVDSTAVPPAASSSSIQQQYHARARTTMNRGCAHSTRLSSHGQAFCLRTTAPHTTM
jgi:hypothetical protein